MQVRCELQNLSFYQCHERPKSFSVKTQKQNKNKYIKNIKNSVFVKIFLKQ